MAHAVTELPTILPIQHIKGHQDRKVPYEDLPLNAQLNVDADRLAGLFQDEHGRPRPRVRPRLPNNNGVQLHLLDGTCTYNLKQSIRYADTAPALLTYIQGRNNWTDEVMETIDWDSHGAAIQRKTHALHLVLVVLQLQKTAITLSNAPMH